MPHRIPALFNDPFNHVPSERVFHFFPRLPAELRALVWTACFPPKRILTLSLSDPTATPQMPAHLNLDTLWDAIRDQAERATTARPIQHNYTARNLLGNVVSGCPYHLAVQRFPIWALCLQTVNLEARDAYRAHYRLRLPFPLRPGPRSTDEESEDSESLLHDLLVQRLLSSSTDHATGDGPALRLNPETDMVEIRLAHTTRFPGPRNRALVDIFLAFLHDGWAYDPKGVGIAHLILGSQEGWPDKLGTVAETWSYSRGKAAASQEASANLAQYFRRFTNSNTHAVYHLIELPKYQRYGRHDDDTDGDHYDRDLGQVFLRRAIPLFPDPLPAPGYHTLPGRYETCQLSEVAAVFESDPRSIEREKDQAEHLLKVSNDEHCIMSVFAHWRVLVMQIGDISDPWAALKSARILVTAAVQSSLAGRGLEPDTQLNRPASLRDELISSIGTADEEELEVYQRYLGYDACDDEADKKVGKFESLLMVNPVPEVFGMWVFGPDAVRELVPVDADPFEPEQTIGLSLEKHRPGLIVFDLDGL